MDEKLLNKLVEDYIKQKRGEEMTENKYLNGGFVFGWLWGHVSLGLLLFTKLGAFLWLVSLFVGVLILAYFETREE